MFEFFYWINLFKDGNLLILRTPCESYISIIQYFEKDVIHIEKWSNIHILCRCLESCESFFKTTKKNEKCSFFTFFK